MTLPQVNPNEVVIESSWREKLAPEFSQPYFGQIKKFLAEEKEKGKIIYPPGPLIFNAFNSTPFDKVRVVILGQDPYHNPGEAMGLCFSVPQAIKVPASLRNIYRELHRDLQLAPPQTGDLSEWAQQGVFLLNAILTVEKGCPGSHSKIGWQRFTDAVIQLLSRDREGLIFMLWGNYARSKKDLIDQRRHTVMEAAHPSPLARDAFQGCGHFSRANQILTQRGEKPVNWKI